MGKLSALFLAGTVAFGAAGSVHAADLPPPPSFEPAPIEPVDFGGWYLRGDVGVGVASKPDIRSSFADGPGLPGSGAATASSVTGFNQQSLDDSAFLGVGAGYQFNNWFRADATGEYRTSQHLSAIEGYSSQGSGTDIFGHAGYTGKDLYSGSVQSSVFLANAYFDIGTWYRLTPFFGAGIGGSYNRVYGLNDIGAGSTSSTGAGNGGFGYARQSSGFDLAYAGYAGLAYSVSPNLKLELAYRYLNMGDVKSSPIQCTVPCASETQKYKLESQDIKLGMRWMFNDTLPVAPASYAPPIYSPPPPLVRKD